MVICPSVLYYAISRLRLTLSPSFRIRKNANKSGETKLDMHISGICSYCLNERQVTADKMTDSSNKAQRRHHQNFV